jgi:hypothetical protein
MHGQYIRSVDRQLVSEEDMFVWLLRGDLKTETEREIMAQNQALQTKYHATEIENSISKCRLCQQYEGQSKSSRNGCIAL